MGTNIVGYDNSRIKQLTTDNTANLAIRVLEYMASSNSYTGSITVGTGNPIGTFVDTARTGGVGSSDITIVSNTYTLSQVNTATLSATQDPPLYFGLDNSIPNTTKLKENLTTLNDLADYILSVAVSTGPFSYYLGTSAPSDGGVWISLGMLQDTLENFTVTNNAYHLWKKISSGAYKNVIRPLRFKNSRLASYTDSEIDAIAKIVEQRIISTGIGTYALQTSTPVTGTWSTAGTITDVRRTTIEVNYDALIPANYTGIAEVTYEGISNVGYDGITYLDYLGASPADYLGPSDTNYLGPSDTNYLGASPTFYLGPSFVDYLGPSSATYTGTTTVAYEGFSNVGYDGITFLNYLGPSAASYLGPSAASYLGPGPVGYVGPGSASYLGPSPATYTGVTPANFSGPGGETSFVGSPVPTNFTGPSSQVVFNSPIFFGPVNFTGPPQTLYFTSQSNYEGRLILPYTGTGYYASTVPGPTYTGAQGFGAAYQGTVPGPTYQGTVPGPSYLGTIFVSYTGTTAANFFGFAPDSQFFTGFVPNAQTFTGFAPDSQFFTGFVPNSQNFTGFVPDSQFFSTPAPATFFGPTPTNFFGTVPTDFFGTIPDSQNFAGIVPDSVNYEGTLPESANYTGTVLDSANYTGTVLDSVNYGGIAPDTQFFSTALPETFFGPTPTNFFGFVPSDYTGVAPASFVGQVVNSVTETITTITLYKRIG